MEARKSTIKFNEWVWKTPKIISMYFDWYFNSTEFQIMIYDGFRTDPLTPNTFVDKKNQRIPYEWISKQTERLNLWE